MSRVILMCGPAGSGKTTVARQLEAEGIVRLSIDDEAWRMGYRSHPLPEDVTTEITTKLQSKLIELVHQGRDVVLDFSFWSKDARDEYRHLLAPLGVTPETVYLATTRDEVLERVQARDNSAPDSIVLPRETVEAYFDGFEAPSPDEGPLRIIHADSE